MWVSASEKSLRERIASCGADPLETAIAARYRHGLDIEIPELSERVFISTAAKGLFPSHFAVRQLVLEALLQKPIGSRLWIRTDSQGRTAPDTLTLSPRTFNLYLPDALTRVPDPERLVLRSRILKSTLLLIAPTGGLDPFQTMFSDTWEHRGAFEVNGNTRTAILGLLGKGAGSTGIRHRCIVAHCSRFLRDPVPRSHHPDEHRIPENGASGPVRESSDRAAQMSFSSIPPIALRVGPQSQKAWEHLGA